MNSTTAEVEEKAKSAAVSAEGSASAIERRRRRRAKISAQVHVKAVNAPEPFEEVCMSIDVSRDGLLFTAGTPATGRASSSTSHFPIRPQRRR